MHVAGSIILAPVSLLLSGVVIEAVKAAAAAKEVLVERSKFAELSRCLETIVPVLKELQARHGGDRLPPSLRPVLESLDLEMKAAAALVHECTTKSKIYLLYHSRDVSRRLEVVIHGIGRCLSLVPLASLDVPMEIKSQTLDLCKHMQEVKFKAAVAQGGIVEKLDACIKETDADVSGAKDLLYQIARVVGVPDDLEFLRKELHMLKQEKEDALLRKKQAEAMQLEQIIGYLSHADTLHSASEKERDYRHRRDSSGTQLLPPWKSFYCPLTDRIMEDPVDIASGQTCERSAVEAWFNAGNTTCPITKAQLNSLEVRPNIPLRNSIREWRDRNTIFLIRSSASRLRSEDEEENVAGLKELYKLSEEKPVHKIWIRAEDLIPIITSILSRRSRILRISALQTLHSLAVDDTSNKEKIAEAGAVSHAVHSLGRHIDESRYAVALLLELSKERGICEQIGKAQGCILLLVAMSNNNEDQAAEDAKQLLHNLSSNNQNVVQMAEANYFKPLVQHLLEGSETTKTLMSAALARMRLTDQGKAAIAREGVIPVLVKMISTGKLERKTAALGALHNLSSHPENCSRMINAGVISPLLQLLFSVTSVSMNLKELAAATLANLATATLPDADLSDCTNVLDSDDRINEFLSLLSLVAPVNQGHLLRALYGMASPPQAISVRAKMKDGGAIQFLLSFCEADDAEVRANAVKLLHCLSRDGIEDELVEHFGETYVGALVKLLSSDRDDEKVAAAGIIGSLPENHLHLTRMLCAADALPALLEMLEIGESNYSARYSKDLLVETASRALRRFTLPSDVKLQRLAAEKDAIPLLVRVLHVGSPLAKREAAIALSRFSESTGNLSVRVPKRSRLWCFSSKAQEGCRVHGGQCSVRGSFCLVEADAVVPLIQMLEMEGEGEAQEAALGALGTLVVKEGEGETWEEGVGVIAEAGGVEAIVKLLTWWAQEGTSAGVVEKAVGLLERFLRLDKYKNDVGGVGGGGEWRTKVQLPLIEIAQKAGSSSASKSLAARCLAHLSVLHDQSSYF